jgi:hypothetical protein
MLKSKFALTTIFLVGSLGLAIAQGGGTGAGGDGGGASGGGAAGAGASGEGGGAGGTGSAGNSGGAEQRGAGQSDARPAPGANPNSSMTGGVAGTPGTDTPKR